MRFSMNTATAGQVSRHLQLCDAAFTRALSLRVDISEYAAKIAGRSLRFEAWSGSDLAGLVAAYFNDPATGVAFITNVSVLPAWNRRGIGRQLLGNCIDHARKLGRRELRLEVAQGQLAAIRLYQSLGFDDCGASRGPAAAESRVMHLELQPPSLKEARS